ncbi:MAG: winged helix DNA-binding domain-containing protein [Alphaproteobacteria bacterium]|nr:winged helix DNA-binding domain-containing protein [Alphaproteobacteria bacterium]
MARSTRTTPIGSGTLSLAEARRLAVQAQAFGPDRSGAPAKRPALLRTLKMVGLLQLDSVNVLVRSHYLPLFSRLGPYDVGLLDALSQKKPRALFEYWGHEASLIPVEFHPLFRWRMQRAQDGTGLWGGPSRLAKERPDFVAAILNEIKERGPIGAGELSDGGRSTGNWWGWSDGKRALEYLFWTGQVTAAGRRGFERLYDLPGRVIPQNILDLSAPSAADAQRTLLEIAAKAFGVATEMDLRDYFRLGVADTKAAIADLVAGQVLHEVAVEGWKHKAYIHRDAKAPRESHVHALISPFDSLIWMRQRTERLFGFHYRLAFYTPKHKRTQGYYVMPFVMPFLLDDRLVARVDLKSDRKENRLLVLGGHAEPGIDPKHVAPALKAELQRLAQWLALDRVVIKSRTELAQALRKA